MISSAIHASPDAMPLRRRAIRGLAIGATAAFLLAFVGALGTDQAPFPERLAYWLAVILPGTVLGLGAQALVNGWGLFARRPFLQIALVALLVAIPHTFAVIVASALFFGSAAITLSLVANFFIAVLVLALMLTAINRLAATPMPSSPEGMPQRAEPLPEPTASAEPQAPALPAIPELLADKLPPRLRAGRMLAIEAEDHYLRIHTDLGSDLVLMRMVDACALMDERWGARVHRSWWVARAAVTGIERQSGRMELRLANGLSAPVARAMQAAVRDAGWDRTQA